MPRLLPAALLVLLAACGGPAPPPNPDALPLPANLATPPAEAAAEPPMPPLALLPRARWQRIRVDPRGDLAAAFQASAMEPQPDGMQRRWIVANLKRPIPLPETGGTAASVAFLADYRCDRHGWRPIEIVWFARRDAQAEALRERPRDRAERVVQEGTLVDLFLDAACGL